MVVTKASYPKGKLILVPLVPLQNVLTKHVGSGFCVATVDDVDVYVVQPSRPPVSKTEFKDWGDDSNLLAFWWAMSDSTADENDGNMEFVEKKFGAVKIRALTNSKAVGVHTRLRLLKKAAAEKKPLGNVITAVKVDPHAAEEGANPDKRRRTR